MEAWFREVLVARAGPILHAMLTTLGAGALLVLIARWLFRAGGPLNK